MQGREKGARERAAGLLFDKYNHSVLLFYSQFAKCINHFICCPTSLQSEVLGLCLCLWPRYGKAIRAIALHKLNKQRCASLSVRQMIWYLSGFCFVFFFLCIHWRTLWHQCAFDTLFPCYKQILNTATYVLILWWFKNKFFFLNSP